LQSNFETQRKNEEKADESSLNETKKREEDVEMTTNPTAITNETKEEQPSKVESIRLSRDPEEKKRDAEKLKKQTSKTIVEPQNIADEGLVEHEVSKLEGVSLPDDERDENADKVLLVDEVELTPDSESLFAEEFEPNVLQSKENSEETQSTVPLEKRVFKITKEEKKFDLHEQHFDPVNALTDYQMPGIELLDVVKTTKKGNTDEEIYENLNKIARTLEAFKISITDDVRAEIGPTVTLYEIVPAPGIKISQIRKVADDIALSLSAIGIRIIAPMPGRGTIGIEVPNKNREKVSLRALIESETFTNTRKELPIVFGKTISNDIFITDLAKMPHLLIGGATGQGKSVGINVVLTSLLYKKHPGELKFVLIDPKKVEFSIYDKLSKHYLAELPDSKSPVITDADESLRVLESLCLEMDNRYELLKNSDCRQILEYNRKFESGELDMTEGNRFLPYIVVVIDELADLMITTNKAIERPIARLAQMARAVGIHLVVATQRPSVNVITGVIKANFPARMAFKVTSKTDSRVILDVDGAEQLLGMGDMLLTNGSDIIRLQCAYVDTMEVERITNFIGEQKGYAAPYYLPE
jgi:S-DNA-T family DNA segregation ATPase FtsK/SpoIIIE